MFEASLSASFLAILFFCQQALCVSFDFDQFNEESKNKKVEIEFEHIYMAWRLDNFTNVCGFLNLLMKMLIFAFGDGEFCKQNWRWNGRKMKKRMCVDRPAENGRKIEYLEERRAEADCDRSEQIAERCAIRASPPAINKCECSSL